MRCHSPNVQLAEGNQRSEGFKRQPCTIMKHKNVMQLVQELRKEFGALLPSGGG